MWLLAIECMDNTQEANKSKRKSVRNVRNVSGRLCLAPTPEGCHGHQCEEHEEDGGTLSGGGDAAGRAALIRGFAAFAAFAALAAGILDHIFAAHGTGVSQTLAGFVADHAFRTFATDSAAAVVAADHAVAGRGAIALALNTGLSFRALAATPAAAIITTGHAFTGRGADARTINALAGGADAAGATTAVVAALQAVADRGAITGTINALAERALATASAAAVVATLETCADGNALAQTFHALFAVRTLATGSTTAIIAADLARTIRLAVQAHVVRADFAALAFAAGSAAAIVAALLAFAVGNALTFAYALNALLAIGTGAIVDAGRAGLFAIAHAVAALGSHFYGATTAIADAFANADVVPLGVAAVGVQLTDTSLAWATLAGRSFQGLTACAAVAHAVRALAAIRAHTALAAAAVAAAGLTRTIGHALDAGTLYALLAVAARRVAADTVIGICTGIIGAAIGAAVVPRVVRAPTASRVLSRTIDAVERTVEAVDNAAQVIAAAGLGDVAAFSGAGVLGTKTIGRVLGQDG